MIWLKDDKKMNKVASYLQSHLSGEVLVNEKIRERFSTDASVLSIKPSMIVHPRTTNDIRKVARFTWQLAERGHTLPMTPRGNGTDLTGASIGKGVILSLPTHLNKILEIDTKQRLVRVQPGVNFKSLQETLQTHGLFLPPAPESYEYSTIGGAVANNASGIRSFMYGDMSAWVDKLEVILANGEVIETGPLSKSEVSKKLGLPTLEGEIYRAIDAILTDGADAINTYNNAINASSDNVGYAFQSLTTNKGGLDLTGLFVGAQGTLGIISEIILKVAPYTPASTLIVAAFENMDDALEAAQRIQKFEPSAVELVDKDMLLFVQKHNNVILHDNLMIGGSLGNLLFIESHNKSERALAKFTKQTIKQISQLTDSYLSASDFEDREKLWSYRYATATFMSHDTAGKSALPVVAGVSVPEAALHQFMEDTKSLAKKHHFELGLWVHVQSSEVVAVPLVELGKLGDRQRVFKFMDEYFKQTIKLGGSIATTGAEGRLRSPFSEVQTGNNMIALYRQLRTAADPHGTMNPGVKATDTVAELGEILRHDYSLDVFGDYLPRL